MMTPNPINGCLYIKLVYQSREFLPPQERDHGCHSKEGAEGDRVYFPFSTAAGAG